MTRRRVLRTFAILIPVVALGLGTFSLAGGSFQGSPTTTTLTGDAADIVDRSPVGGKQPACSFADPCSPAALPADSMARVTLSAHASPNPNSCWYCLLHGTADTYTPWYIGVDYASPVATLHVSAGQTPEPVLTVTGSQAAAVLALDGYDLGYLPRITAFVCVAQLCPSARASIPIAPGLRFSMSSPVSSDELWEIVPIMAEREDAHTDNAWYRFGEKRSSTLQKIVIGFEEVAFS
ncbi:hypothetical protein KDL01_40220 [Actinospica durhamensis]|uniref:Uncharacterized protein n=1 Tax=Actinospica durhamensis TaxID=1508375 RepID=A0A941IS51_9ACTN|nr:hypothetical protein [Actinospica durhamensis]MBR7839550.1 hypothetical protein [Actinospica durhamensis]